MESESGLNKKSPALRAKGLIEVGGGLEISNHVFSHFLTGCDDKVHFMNIFY